MKLIVKLSIILLVVIFSQAFAQTGEITGFVYNGTQDSAAVKNIQVELLVYRGMDLVDDSSYSTKTNSRGKFRFKGLNPDKELSFFPRATFKSIVYYGNGVQFMHGKSKLESNVVVYDTTSNMNDITMQLEHLFVDEVSGKIFIKDIYVIQNRGNKTYLGKKTKISNRPYVLEFPLPDGAENLEILTHEAQHTSFVENQKLYNSELLSPGTKRISFQYQVPVKKSEWRFERPVIYPLASVNIFVANPELVLEGPGLVSHGNFQIREDSYQHYSLQHLMPGMVFSLTFKNLTGKALPVQWFVLIAVAVFLVAGLGYTFIKK